MRIFKLAFFPGINSVFFRLFLIFILLQGNPVFSQQFNFTASGTEDGLPQSTVYEIFQDRTGYLWMGTDGGGLTRYDGFRFKTYDKHNGLRGNVIRRVAQDRDGLLWIASNEGLHYLQNEQVHAFDQIQGNASTVFTAVFVDSRNNLWASSSGKGVFKITFSGGSFSVKQYSQSDGLSSDYIFDICEDHKKNIWLASFRSGLDVFNPATNQFRTVKQEKESINEVIALKCSRSGNIVFGTTDGAYVLQEGESEQAVRQINGTGNNQVWSIMEDQAGNFWLSTDKSGIVCTNSRMSLNKKNGLPSNNTFKIIADRENNLWIGTGDDGIGKFAGGRFTHVTPAELPGLSRVSALLIDRQNTFWAGSSNGLYAFRYTEGAVIPVSYFNTANGLPANEITGLSPDRKKGIWVSTRKGISYFDGKVFKNYNEAGGLASNNANCILADSKNRIWIGTLGGLSLLNEQKQFSTMSETNGLVNNEVQCLYEDKKGNIWIGTLGGLIKFDGEKLYTFNQEDGLLENKIYSLAEDKSGNIYIGTFGGGIFKHTASSSAKNSIRKLPANGLLSSDNIYSLAFESDSVLIAASNKGISKIIFSNDLSGIRSVKTFGKPEGFSHPENSQNASLADGNNVFFGTTGGITIYHAAADVINDVKPELQITGFYINGSPAAIADHNQLTYDQNAIKIPFIAVSLTNPSKNAYYARLAGYDTSWNKVIIDKDNTGEFAFVEYRKLSPGQYELFLKARNNDGIESGIKSVRFFIAQPFYKTKWFIAGTALLFILLVYFFFKLREKSLVREKEKLETIVSQRTAEVVESKREIESQKNLLEIQKHEITDSINYSKRIQNAILPEQYRLFDRFPDSFIIYQPKDIVSGDFYFFSESEEGFFVAVADCTGHGVPGAFMSMIGSKELTEAVKARSQPKDILSALNVGMRKTLKQNNLEFGIKDGMDIGFLRLKPTVEGKICVNYSGANRPLWIIRKGQKEVTEIKATKAAIGGYTPDDQVFEQHEILLEKGDSIYLFSDGFADQFGGEYGKKLMTKRFKELLLESAHASMPDQQQFLDSFFSSWKGGVNEQVDDVCIIGIRA